MKQVVKWTQFDSLPAQAELTMNDENKCVSVRILGFGGAYKHDYKEPKDLSESEYFDTEEEALMHLIAKYEGLVVRWRILSEGLEDYCAETKRRLSLCTVSLSKQKDRLAEIEKEGA